MVENYRKMLMIDSYTSSIEREKELIGEFEKRIDKIADQCPHDISICFKSTDLKMGYNTYVQKECECLFCRRKVEGKYVIDMSHLEIVKEDKNLDYEYKRKMAKNLFASYLYDKNDYTTAELVDCINKELFESKGKIKNRIEG